MEIVIKIPDEDLHDIKCEGIKFIRQREMLWRAIANGTPLPKGHGRLIDADKLDTRERGNNSQRAMWWNIDCIVKDAETIVEADKGSDNLPSCNNCVHNGEQASTGNCIKCSGFDRYEKAGKG